MYTFEKLYLQKLYLLQVEREKLRTEEVASKTVLQRSELDKVISRLEEENVEMNKQLHVTQNQLSEAEQTHAQR